MHIFSQQFPPLFTSWHRHTPICTGQQVPKKICVRSMPDIHTPAHAHSSAQTQIQTYHTYMLFLFHTFALLIITQTHTLHAHTYSIEWIRNPPLLKSREIKSPHKPPPTHTNAYPTPPSHTQNLMLAPRIDSCSSATGVLFFSDSFTAFKCVFIAMSTPTSSHPSHTQIRILRPAPQYHPSNRPRIFTLRNKPSTRQSPAPKRSTDHGGNSESHIPHSRSTFTSQFLPEARADPIYTRACDWDAADTRPSPPSTRSVYNLFESCSPSARVEVPGRPSSDPFACV